MAPISQHEIDAQVENAMHAKARHGYATQAVVVKSWTDVSSPRLGFFFEDGHAIGEVARRADGTHFEVLAIV